MRGAPILYDGFLYVCSLAGFLNAIDTHTGKVRWRFRTTAPIHSTPSLNSGQVLVTCDGGTLYAIDSSSGAKIWDVPTGGEVWTSAVVSKDTIFFGNTNGHMQADRKSTRLNSSH